MEAVTSGAATSWAAGLGSTAAGREAIGAATLLRGWEGVAAGTGSGGLCRGGLWTRLLQSLGRRVRCGRGHLRDRSRLARVDGSIVAGRGSRLARPLGSPAQGHEAPRAAPGQESRDPEGGCDPRAGPLGGRRNSSPSRGGPSWLRLWRWRDGAGPFPGTDRWSRRLGDEARQLGLDIRLAAELTRSVGAPIRLAHSSGGDLSAVHPGRSDPGALVPWWATGKDVVEVLGHRLPVGIPVRRILRQAAGDDVVELGGQGWAPGAWEAAGLRAARA